MAIDPTAFERYRRLPNEKTTLPRLIVGAIVVAICWFAVTIGVVFAGTYGWVASGAEGALTFEEGPILERFLTTAGGLLATLATFGGIWLGIWIAMRALHKEKLKRLFGNSARLSRSGFLNGFGAVLITSLLTELCYLIIIPDVGLGPIGLGTWMLFLLPILFLGFVQTSSEELLFRGYLQRGLAYRFKSPIVWAVLPTLVFTALHWNPGSALGMNIGVAVSIGAFAALLALLVYATGNLGAAMGAHFGNNIVGFLLISHDDTLGGLALFRAPPLDGLAWTATETATIAGISIVSILLTWLLLFHPRSPLKVKPDLADPRGEPETVPEELDGPLVAEGPALDELLATKLAEVATDSSGWHRLYRHQDTGKFWELDYPHSEMHGGGPRRLRELQIADADQWTVSDSPLPGLQQP